MNMEMIVVIVVQVVTHIMYVKMAVAVAVAAMVLVNPVQTLWGLPGLLDCQLQCIDQYIIDAWLGDGLCDDGTWGVLFRL